MIKAVIFDMDGVLINSVKANLLSVLKGFLDMGLSLKKEDFKKVIGRHPKDYLPLLEEKYGFAYEEMISNINTHYRALTGDVDLLPHVKETLYKLRGENIRIAVATTNTAEFVEKKLLDKYHLNNMFDVIITFEDCRARKPDPEIYRQAVERLDLPPEECVVIEDTTIGVDAAKNAGLKCIAVPNEETQDQDFSAADAVIKTLAELTPEFLRSRFLL